MEVERDEGSEEGGVDTSRREIGGRSVETIAVERLALRRIGRVEREREGRARDGERGWRWLRRDGATVETIERKVGFY